MAGPLNNCQASTQTLPPQPQVTRASLPGGQSWESPQVPCSAAWQHQRALRLYPGSGTQAGFGCQALGHSEKPIGPAALLQAASPLLCAPKQPGRTGTSHTSHQGDAQTVSTPAPSWAALCSARPHQGCRQPEHRTWSAQWSCQGDPSPPSLPASLPP